MPLLARLGRERLERRRLAFIGTLRRDGGPRLSPVEVLFVDDHLYVGMMPRSMKARDLFRDPRCALHSVTTDPNGEEGDFKLYGRAIPATDPALRARLHDAVFEATGWRPPDEAHDFTIDIEVAAFALFGAKADELARQAERESGLRVRFMPGSAGTPNVALVWRAP
ncbi:MAG TPA: pyridoxamine 5'-phosphate oxidase family protein [Dehalococcoidia bacterium]|nr:pyridoxamine 5'-phosphate oxidase family protein [Dehalococcoidia bacterium]